MGMSKFQISQLTETSNNFGHKTELSRLSPVDQKIFTPVIANSKMKFYLAKNEDIFSQDQDTDREVNALLTYRDKEIGHQPDFMG